MATEKAIMETTKATIVYKQYNDMASNVYVQVYGRIYNSDKTRYRHLSMIVWLDIDEVCEYWDKDAVSDRDIRQCAAEIALNNMYAYCSDYNNVSALYEYANSTIKRYNELMDRCYKSFIW